MGRTFRRDGTAKETSEMRHDDDAADQSDYPSRTAMNFDFYVRHENAAAANPTFRRTNALFVCSFGRMRSLTAEHVFATRDDLYVAAAGVYADAENPVTAELLQWADIIFVMEDVHRNKLAEKFADALQGTQIVSLGIPDRYEYMDPQLVRLLKTKVSKIFGE
jgi:predicted protein tyrosine phosphatase